MPASVDFFEQVAALRRQGTSFATATVVGRRPPVSAHLGDRAIVYADGRMEGFVGGACSREIVRKQALEAIRTGAGRIVSIRPDVAADVSGGPDRVVVAMTCVSEGAVEVYVEPFVQPRHIVVVGATPIASALARVARSLDYRVTRVVDERERADLESESAQLGYALASIDTLASVLGAQAGGGDDRAVVVSSQGHYDEEAVEAALRASVPYVGLVASRSRGGAVRALLDERGVRGVAALRNPAGLDLGARMPGEVALSILAEIVQADAAHQARDAAVAPDTGAVAPPGEPAGVAIDPVCGMDVDMASARYTADLDGAIYYFCGAGCRTRFLKRPGEFLSQA